MQDRIKMNTESLQKEFPEVYQDFFVNHDLVVSGCFSLAWSPAGIWQHDMLNYIKQKLPTKCYIWIKKRKDTKIIFNKIGFYNINTKIFEYFPFQEINNQEKIILEYLYDLKDKFNINYWLDITIFSENMRGHWVGFSWTISAILMSWLSILFWEMLVKNLEGYDVFVNSDMFKKIHLRGFKQDFLSRFGKTLWENSLFTLLNTNNPIFYLNEKNHKKNYKDLNNNGMKYFDVLKEFKDNFDDDSIATDIPLDYAIIFSGKKSKTEQVEYYRDLDMMKWKKIKEFILNKIEFLKNTENEYWLKDFLIEGDIESWYNKMILTLNAQLLYYFDKIINEGYEVSNISNFINQINLYRYAISLVENQNPFADNFIKKFNSLKNIEDEQLWIMPMYSGKFGWCYLIAMKENYNRETLYETIFSLKNKYINCTIEYASWLDGSSSDGVKIEQFVSEEIYSKYFDKDKLVLQTNKWEKTLGEHGELMKKMWDGILVDTINRKIYVNGQKLTSKDIPSQATTVEVLSVLLENEWKEVSNNIFEVSSYSKNKNDMIGKIVIPLTKLTKKYFDKEIALTCKGSLIEFQMLLQEREITIWIIKKL